MNRNLAVTIFAAMLLIYAGPGSSSVSPPGSPSAPVRKAYDVTQLYSNASGDSQFIQIDELSGSNGDDQLFGSVISVTNRHGVTKRLPLPSSLRGAIAAHKRVVIVSSALAATLPPSFADYVMPNQFLPTDGGEISFAAGEPWIYDALPTVGVSLTRDGATSSALMQNSKREFAYAGSGIDAIYEFYSESLKHYFMSGAQPDIDALDSGNIPGWVRTGEVLYAPTVPAALSLPVCRYYLPAGSHFFSVSPEECKDVAERFPSVVLETSNAFNSWLPLAATGNCPILPKNEIDVTLVPVYRLWNNQLDTNHRYTMDPQVRADMIASGWVPEGYGPMGVGLCVPATAQL